MKSFEPKLTTDPNLFRMVDRNGDWTHYWYKPKNKYLRAVNFILEEGYAQPELLHWAKNPPREQIEKKLKVSQEKGDAVHKYIAKVFATRQRKILLTREITIFDDETKQDRILTNEEFDCVLAWAEFWKRHNPKLLGYELSCYSLKYGYAGTADTILVLQKACEVRACSCKEIVGKTGIWDWKSGGGIWDSHGPQVAAYGNSESLNAYLRKIGAEKLSYSSILRIGTKHITTGGYQMEIYDKEESRVHWGEFLSAITQHNRKYKPFDPKTEIYEIPDSVEINLEIWEKPTIKRNDQKRKYPKVEYPYKLSQTGINKSPKKWKIQIR